MTRTRGHVGLAAAALALLTACGAQNSPTDGISGNGQLVPDGGLSCAQPATGCACNDPGTTATCGQVVDMVDNFVTCSMGTRTCENGAWGACLGTTGSETITTKVLSSVGQFQFNTYGVATSCGDPCDAQYSCTQFADTGYGLDAGSSFVSTDAGLALNGTFVPPSTCTGLTITPSTSPAKDIAVTAVNTTTDAPSPATVQFTATLSPAGCYTGTVPALWSVDKFDISQISSTGLLTLVTPIAGPITVSAFAGTLTATAVVSNVTVNVVDTTVGPAPTGYASIFTSATPGTADSFTILYPYAATVFPLGLPPPLIQWSAATAAAAVKVSLRYPTTGTVIFNWAEVVPESQLLPAPSNTLAAQPRATIPQDVWNDFQQTVVRNSPSGGDAVFAIQRAIKVGTVNKIYNEVTRTIHFANGQLKGNVYYNSYGTNLVANFSSTVDGAAFGAATLTVPINGTVPTVVAGYASSGTSGAGCRVCHTVSGSGTRLLTNLYAPSDTTTSTYDLTTSPPTESDMPANTGALTNRTSGTGQFSWAALSFDGSYLFTNGSPATSTIFLQGSSSSYASNLYDVTAGAAGTQITGGTTFTTLQATTPSFSPDMAHIAFNFYTGSPAPLANPPTTPKTGDGKTISMMDFAPPKTFSNFRNLYTPTVGSGFWPVFLPSGQNGVVFEHEIANNGRDTAGTRELSSFDCVPGGSCSNAAPTGTTSELWWVNTTGTATPVALQEVNGLSGGVSYLPTGTNLHGNPANTASNDTIYNYEPTVLPQVVGGYSWIVFTSRRMYGNVATINPYWSDPRYHDISIQPTPKKLWVAAISQNPTAGTDPSFPAFYLPGQELLAGNARAYFALAACAAPTSPVSASSVCSSNLDCCTGSSCQLDPPPLASPPTSHCVANSTTSCVANGSTCTTDASCCTFGTGSRCASGLCTPPPPALVYPTATTQRVYVASCAAATNVVWQTLSWSATTPTNTSIAFTAQTSSDGVTWGTSVPIGTASSANTTMTAPQTVDTALHANGQVSQSQLLLSALFTPTLGPPAATPTLASWTIKYDCRPSE